MTDSSSEAAAAPAIEPATVSDVNPAPDTSTEAPKGVEATLLDRVTSALEKGTGSPAVETGKANAAPSDTTPKDKPDEIEPNAETGTYPKTAQGRIRYLNDRTKHLAGEVERLVPDAQVGRQVLEYIDTRGIKPEELDNILELAALTKSGRYDDALKVLTPIFTELQTRAGNVLPADLQQQVQLGHLTLTHAKELHKARTTVNNATQREEAERRTRAEQSAQARHAETVRTSASAADEWGRNKAVTDPDWSLKQDLVSAEVELRARRMAANGKFPTAQETVGMLEESLKVVEGRLKTLAPKPTAVRTVTGAPASPRSQSRPTTLMAAIDQALAA